MTRALPVVDRSRVVRDCGTCSLCCTVMGVETISKPKNVRCAHLSTLGRCSCYASRPAACAEFNCLWKQGLLPESLQPSRVRAVGDIAANADVIVFHVAPADRGAHRRGVLRDFIDRATASGTLSVIVCCGDERLLLTRNETVSHAVADLMQQST